MTEVFFIGWAVGILTGHVAFAPETRFKRAFMDGLTLRKVWGKR